MIHAASMWWIHPLLLLFCFIDGFAPILPSETLIVALSALSVSSGQPNLGFVAIAGFLGAVAGDQVAYRMGRAAGASGFRWMQGARAQATLHWARRELDKRGAMLILTARYIPVGRVAVNFTAGATRFPLRQFTILDIIACATWIGYGIGIGIVAGAWVHEHPLLGAGLAIVIAIAIGFLIDHAMQWVSRIRARRVARAEAAGGTTAARPAADADPASVRENVRSENA
ncbi:DedA family protein [Tersicoccus solisilvae]|uniref:DedA family protein n=1 Tax=Tersicoccus solisilvae TaxID=1882339 RepID=UPI00166855E3|nr:VTT domain-containing protein [Tersicoccus solisilvae]